MSSQRHEGRLSLFLGIGLIISALLFEFIHQYFFPELVREVHDMIHPEKGGAILSVNELKPVFLLVEGVPLLMLFTGVTCVWLFMRGKK